MKFVRMCFFIVIVVMAAQVVIASGPKPVKPGTKDKCPVCGMFVAKYPDFASQIQFKNGSAVHFDGVKDLVKYYLQIGRYNPKVSAKDIAAIFVTDYYTLAPIDGFSASYVTGSDVYGPMGRELIPFAKAKDAQEFKKDHKGKRVIRFGELNQALLKELD